MAALSPGSEKTTTRLALLNTGAEAIVSIPEKSLQPGLLVPIDIFGIRPVFEDLCRRIGTYGVPVVAIEPFWRIPSKRRLEMNQAARRVAVASLDDAEQLGDLLAGVDLLANETGVTEFDILGFCAGGYYALKAAATGSFRRVVTCYGMTDTPTMWDTAGHRSPMDTIDEVCPTLAAFGGVDHWTPASQIDALRSAWVERPDCEVIVYPKADHGFVHDPDSEHHRADDAADFWTRVIGFLGWE